MKWLALLFLVVLAEGSENRRKPQGYDDREEISKTKIDHKLIVKEYKDGALTFPPPAIEHGDCGANRFKDDYTRVGTRWGQEINDVIYNQGVAVGRELIEEIEEKYNKLAYSIDQSSKKPEEDNYVEKNLQYLVNQLRTFLDLKPGDQIIKHKPLPELPDIPRKIVSQTKNRTACDFFLHLPEFYDEDMSSIYGYVAGIFLRGWYNTRKYFDIQQTEYRNQILNGPVLTAYRKIVDEVFKSYHYIEHSVSKDAWESFRAAGTRVIELSNEWQKTLAKLENYKKRG